MKVVGAFKCNNCDWALQYTEEARELARMAGDEHDKICPNHPIRKLEAEKNRLALDNQDLRVRNDVLEKEVWAYRNRLASADEELRGLHTKLTAYEEAQQEFLTQRDAMEKLIKKLQEENELMKALYKGAGS